MSEQQADRRTATFVVLTFRATYTTRDGEQWAVTYRVTFDKWMVDEYEIRQRTRTHFDKLFAHELVQRGHLYGAMIGQIEVTEDEQSWYASIMPEQPIPFTVQRMEKKGGGAG